VAIYEAIVDFQAQKQIWGEYGKESEKSYFALEFYPKLFSKHFQNKNPKNIFKNFKKNLKKLKNF